MSEHDEQPPLTRRERRIREMGETGAMPVVDPIAAMAAGSEFAAGREQAQRGDAAAPEVEISPCDADGRPRTRRELRELREQALADLAARRAGGNTDSDVSTAGDATHGAGAAGAAAAADPVGHADPDGHAAPAGDAGGGSLFESNDNVASVATQAFSLTEFEEANGGVSREDADRRGSGDVADAFAAIIAAPAEAPAPDSGSDTAPQESPEPAAPVAEERGGGEAPAQPEKPKGARRLRLWQRSRANAEPAEEQPTPAEERPAPLDAAASGHGSVPAEDSAPAEDSGPVEDSGAAEESGPAEHAEPVEESRVAEHSEPAEELRLETADAEPQLSPPGDAADAEVVHADLIEDTRSARAGVPASGAEADSATEADDPRPGFSFPDIVPLDEGASVFDDPAIRTMSASGGGEPTPSGGDFNELIARAVAQEGAASGASSSALILPTMPPGGELSGPLGETGELYITGSIDLPRSLGETGGHSALHDSVELDPVEEFDLDSPALRESGTAPVSAARAVSARSMPGPVVTEAQKERSKLPIVLMVTGGGLLVGVAALAAWSISSGVFG